jgi:hypothetical protein
MNKSTSNENTVSSSATRGMNSYVAVPIIPAGKHKATYGGATFVPKSVTPKVNRTTGEVKANIDGWEHRFIFTNLRDADDFGIELREGTSTNYGSANSMNTKLIDCFLGHSPTRGELAAYDHNDYIGMTLIVEYTLEKSVDRVDSNGRKIPGVEFNRWVWVSKD